MQVIKRRHLYVDVFIGSYLLAVVSGGSAVVVDVVGSVVAAKTRREFHIYNCVYFVFGFLTFAFPLCLCNCHVYAFTVHR